MKRIYFTVTNDLSYDQRMHRICTTLAENGYQVTLVGRKLSASLPLQEKKFHQKRIRCLYNKGKLFYLEYNARLFLYLLSRKIDAICAIDLDTIVPVYMTSLIKGIPRIYDAHELFTELKEVRMRPGVKKMWMRVEKRMVPKFRKGYTVSEGIAVEFRKRYSTEYKVIRNFPILESLPGLPEQSSFILYQGAVNVARGFEYLIPAMQWVDRRLVICGDGNFMPELKKLISTNKLEDKIELKGMLLPEEMRKLAQQASMGIALAEREGLNQYLALPNKFLDYIHAGLPQVTMDYPEYRKVNQQFEVALLINDLDPVKIAGSINNLLGDPVLYGRLQENSLKAREEMKWQEEEKKILQIYHSVFDQ